MNILNGDDTIQNHNNVICCLDLKVIFNLSEFEELSMVHWVVHYILPS